MLWLVRVPAPAFFVIPLVLTWTAPSASCRHAPIIFQVAHESTVEPSTHWPSGHLQSACHSHMGEIFWTCGRGFKREGANGYQITARKGINIDDWPGVMQELKKMKM
jgi:hypothetical protein